MLLCRHTLRRLSHLPSLRRRLLGLRRIPRDGVRRGDVLCRRVRHGHGHGHGLLALLHGRHDGRWRLPWLHRCDGIRPRLHNTSTAVRLLPGPVRPVILLGLLGLWRTGDHVLRRDWGSGGDGGLYGSPACTVLYSSFVLIVRTAVTQQGNVNI
ncbi:hypothetical protein CALCODRAFT_102116 [Calocera cornea HHB12733]|uniref:Uncharacterized protein n=1 Tax=Calocera cornea HHB12733 TaxID=1353952 RepID=A0A165D518_9BASI|nr:hypothetical protein CALCODRAFT_102116 [Calocera cornea HHB12733]